ncbi:MAG: laccase domain-containing protein [Saprospiraceae bacterium]
MEETAPATGIIFEQPAWAARFPELLIGQTTRAGGVSRPPFDSLNLSLHTDDDPAAVSENRRRLAAALGLPPDRYASGHQVHGKEVYAFSGPGYVAGYDGFITDRPEILLTATVADCCPILIYDPVSGATAAVHAGWPGTVKGTLRETLARMVTDYGTDPADCYAWIGACIDATEFESDADVADRFAPEYKRWDERAGKFFIDLRAANRAYLLGAGLPPDRVEESTTGTLSNSDRFFSHRAAGGGAAGRGVAFICRRARPGEPVPPARRLLPAHAAPPAKRVGEEVFTSISERNYWADAESRSGPGSAHSQTVRLVELLPEVWRDFGVISLLDLPCGDFNWMSRVDLNGIDYLGGDVVAEIVAENRRKFAALGVRFQQIDLLTDTLPAADLVFCRDALVHFSFTDIARALRNLRASLGPATLLMITHFPAEQTNVDIPTGGWRPLNWCAPPFNWPRPRYLLTEGCTEGEGKFGDKALGIWLLGEVTDLSLPE